MANNDNITAGTTPGEIIPPSDGKKGSKFLTIGKYFLVLAAVVFQVGAAYTLVDENYKEVYLSLFGSLPDYTTTVNLEDIIINPANSQGQRFLVVGISLELYHPDRVVLLERNKVRVRERMMHVAASRTVAELVTLEERESMRQEMKEEINSILGSPSVRNLYFTRYIMQ